MDIAGKIRNKNSARKLYEAGYRTGWDNGELGITEELCAHFEMHPDQADVIAQELYRIEHKELILKEMEELGKLVDKARRDNPCYMEAMDPNYDRLCALCMELLRWQ